MLAIYLLTLTPRLGRFCLSSLDDAFEGCLEIRLLRFGPLHWRALRVRLASAGTLSYARAMQVNARPKKRRCGPAIPQRRIGISFAQTSEASASLIRHF